jgi:hypothetical protein
MATTVRIDSHLVTEPLARTPHISMMDFVEPVSAPKAKSANEDQSAADMRPGTARGATGSAWRK